MHNQIGLFQLESGRLEVLEGIGPDEFCISGAMALATIDNMRIFPHIVVAVADNIERAKQLGTQERLETICFLRDCLLTAINEIKTIPNVIIDPTTEENS